MVKLHKSFETENNLTEIIDAILHLEDQKLENNLEVIATNRKIATLVDVTEFETEGFALTQYCNKTGQPVKEMTVQELQILCNIHGKPRAKDIISAQELHCIHPAWLYTDNNALDALAKNDPRGFAVYVTDRILFAFNHNYRKQGKWSEANQQAKLHHHAQLIEAYAATEHVPEHKLVTLNEMATRYLAFVNSAYAIGVVNFTFDSYADAISNYNRFIAEIRDAIIAALKEAQRRGKLKKTVTIDDIIQLRSLYRGNTAFVRRGRMQQISDTEMLELQLAPFLTDLEAKSPRYFKGHEPDEIKNAGKRNLAPVQQTQKGTKFKLFVKSKD